MYVVPELNGTFLILSRGVEQRNLIFTSFYLTCSQNDSNGTGNGGGGGTGEQRPHQNCTFGQKGFRPASSEYLSNKRAKQQLIVATLICTLFMVSFVI